MTIQEIDKNYRLAIIRYLSRLTGSVDEGENLAQEVFIKVHSSLPKYKGNSKLSTWIYKIATNVATDYYRSSSYKKSKKSVEILNPNDDEILKSNLDQNKRPTPEQILITNEMSDCIQNYINKLNDNYKHIILLSDYQDLKNKEIAKVLDVSLDTVKIRLHRARKKLKMMMDRGCEIYENNGELGCNEK